MFNKALYYIGHPVLLEKLDDQCNLHRREKEKVTNLENAAQRNAGQTDAKHEQLMKESYEQRAAHSKEVKRLHQKIEAGEEEVL